MKLDKIDNNLELIDLCLYLHKQHTLIIADTHIGFEEALNKQGLLIPRLQFKDIMVHLENIFLKIKPKTIVINGDIKHEFGNISEQEWRDTLKLIDYLASNCRELVLVKGNHDTILGPIANKRNIKIVDFLVLGDYLIVHGDKEIKKEQLKNIKTIILAHEHPAISLKEEARVELFKCFLIGKYKGKNLIVMPSFNFVTEGTDVLKQELLSPILKEVNLDNFHVYIVSDKVYGFGNIANLR